MGKDSGVGHCGHRPPLVSALGELGHNSIVLEEALTFPYIVM